VAYTYADSSKYFLQEAEKELARYERVEFEMLNLEEGMDKQQMWQKYIKELRYLSKNTFMEIVIFRMELHKM
jgi:hypothetical protein